MRVSMRQVYEELGEHVVRTLLDPKVSQGQKLLLLRQVRGYSRNRLRRASGISNAFIRMVEEGKRRVGRRETALKLDQGLRAGGYLAMGLGFMPDWSAIFQKEDPNAVKKEDSKVAQKEDPGSSREWPWGC